MPVGNGFYLHRLVYKMKFYGQVKGRKWHNTQVEVVAEGSRYFCKMCKKLKHAREFTDERGKQWKTCNVCRATNRAYKKGLKNDNRGNSAQTGN